MAPSLVPALLALARVLDPGAARFLPSGIRELALKFSETKQAYAPQYDECIIEKALKVALTAHSMFLPPELCDFLETSLKEYRVSNTLSEVGNSGVVESSSLEPVMKKQGGATVAVWQGDICKLRVDAITNAANSKLLGCFQPGHACIDNAIHAAAGPWLRVACHAVRTLDRLSVDDAEVRRFCNSELTATGRLTYDEHFAMLQKHEDAGSVRAFEEPTGGARVTPGYLLPAKFVVHTVGPIVHDEVTPDLQQLLVDAYWSVLNASRAVGAQSIALCCISTGVFGYPEEAGAKVALETVRRWLDADRTGSIERVVFNTFTDRSTAIYRELAPLYFGTNPAQGSAHMPSLTFREDLSLCLLQFAPTASVPGPIIQTLSTPRSLPENEYPFLSIVRTRDELSVVVEESVLATLDATELASASGVEHGWRAFCMDGQLDFGLVGILSGISSLLAQANIPIFAISTFNTDWILLKRDVVARARETVQAAGYSVRTLPRSPSPKHA